MSIVTLKKVTIAGSSDEKDKIIASLQDFGLLHVVPMSGSGKKPHLTCDEINDAIKYLTNSASILDQKHDDNFDAEEFARKALETRDAGEAIRNDHKGLYNYIESIKDWGDFDIPNPDRLGGYHLHFYKVDNAGLKILQENKSAIWQLIHEGEQAIYVVVISKDEKGLKIPGAVKVEFTSTTLYEAEKDLEATAGLIEQNETDHIALTNHLDDLLRYKDKLTDKLEYNYVSDYSWDHKGFFLVQGWIAERDIKELEKVAAKKNLALIFEEPKEDEVPPTMLENGMLGAPGEELVKFYQVPSYRMWDPSTVIFLSFALFFSMIVSDFGYGVVFSLITALTWNKMRASETARRIRRMMMILSGTTLIYGLLCGSYFGFHAPIKAIADLAVVDVNNFKSMVSLSVGIGAIHIIIANAIRFVRTLPSLNSLPFLGWILAVSGAFSLYYFGEDTLWAQYDLIAGLGCIFLFSSSRPFNLKGILLRPVDGLLSLTNVTKAFGDCLSYIRLFALGLSSALLAASFNSMAAQAVNTNTVIGIGFGVLIFLFGHSLNILLAIMSGVIHGLRLNFIEFTNWGLEGEGYQFKPFELKEKKKWKI